MPRLGELLAGVNPLVVAAMNPCPCGYAGVRRYLARIPRPLRAGFDMHVVVPGVRPRALRGARTGDDSAAVRARVSAARRRGAGRDLGPRGELLPDRLFRVARTIAHLAGHDARRQFPQPRHGTRELGQLVEKQDTPAGELHLAGSHRTAEHRQHGDGVVGRTEGTFRGYVGQDPGEAPGEHRLARSGRPDQQEVVPARRGDLERASRRLLATYLVQIGRAHDSAFRVQGSAATTRSAHFRSSRNRTLHHPVYVHLEPRDARLCVYLALERMVDRLGEGNPRTDQVRDMMDVLWYTLTDGQHAWLDTR